MNRSAILSQLFNVRTIRQRGAFLTLAVAMTFCIGCSSGPKNDYDSLVESTYTEDGGRAAPATAFMDLFAPTKKLPERKTNSSADFFFKSCSLNGNDNWRSHTAYECTYPW
jgi:hypothetical protein